METLIRPVVRIGNSSGVILPKSWINQEAKVELIVKKPSNLLGDIIRILEDEISLEGVLGIYLTGSYARKENKEDSDIDVLVITDSIGKSIKKGRYEILIVSKKDLTALLDNRAFPLLPMLKESIPLLNENLANEFKNTRLTRKNIGWHIHTTDDAIKKNQNIIMMTKKLKEDRVDDSVAYSLVLRIRGIYIIECLKRNKLWSNKELIKIIKNISGSLLAYERYNYIKNNQGKNKSRLLVDEAEKLLRYIEQKNKKQEEWLKGLKS